jgi:uncharacterized membrane protein
MTTNAILGIVLAALIGAVAYVVMGSSNNRPVATSITPAQASVPPSNASATQQMGRATTQEIAIPVADVSDGKARFFDYAASDGRTVRFFVIKSSDGVYRAALDACDVCFAGKKGYHQEGDAMICNKCGRQFPSTLVNEVTGGCNPIGLPRTVAGDRLLIKASELESRKSYF